MNDRRQEKVRCSYQRTCKARRDLGGCDEATHAGAAFCTHHKRQSLSDKEIRSPLVVSSVSFPTYGSCPEH